MIKLKGFTLAEVLITLGIVGVIASLTMPALMTNVQKNQIGPSFAKAVNSLENSMRYLLASQDARKLDTVCSGKMRDCLKMAMHGTVTTANASYRTPTGTAYTALDSIKGNAFLTQDGIEYIVADGEGADNGYDSFMNAPDNEKYYGKYRKVYIDINGSAKNPNILGRDLFIVLVDLYGFVIPFGGKEYKDVGGQTDWTGGNCDSTSISNPETCAGSVADNGWKVVYKF